MDQSPISAELVLAALKKHGVTHIVRVPDSVTNWLDAPLKESSFLTLIPVSREGLAYSTAAGLSTGGKVPIILIQNTGLMEAGDSLRGWGIGLNIPVVVMVGYRGWTRHGLTKDSAATYTERFLNAFDVSYYIVEKNTDAPRISAAFEEANKTKRPVAVLLADEFHGATR